MKLGGTTDQWMIVFWSTLNAMDAPYRVSPLMGDCNEILPISKERHHSELNSFKVLVVVRDLD